MSVDWINKTIDTQTLELYKEGEGGLAYYNISKYKKSDPKLYERELNVLENAGLKTGLSPSDYKYKWQYDIDKGLNVVDMSPDEAHSNWKRYGNLFGEVERFQKALDDIKADPFATKASYNEFVKEYNEYLWAGGKHHDENSVPWHLSNYPLTQLNNKNHKLKEDIESLAIDRQWRPATTRYKIGHAGDKIEKGIDDGIEKIGDIVGKTLGALLKGIFEQPILLIGGVLIVIVVIEKI